jgi:hypothetical protein
LIAEKRSESTRKELGVAEGLGMTPAAPPCTIQIGKSALYHSKDFNVACRTFQAVSLPQNIKDFQNIEDIKN